MTEQKLPHKADVNLGNQFFEAGHIVGGKYKIISVLGKGGMGTVYHVLHMFLDTEFALKILDKKRVFDELQVKRFQTEAKAANSLDHVNLIKVHDYGLSDDDQPYLVMDFVDGITLADYLKIHGQLTEESALPIFDQICSGLQYAHDKNVVHRDIKPSNIMLLHEKNSAKSNVIKILDFGIAKYTDTESGEIQHLTQTGEIFGSPLYMSPEQCTGDAIDNRSDIYSLGCVFFEVLTGTPPHVGTSALRTMNLHQSEPAPKLSEASLGKKYSEGIQRTIEKMLEKDPNKRQQSLDQVLRELKSFTKQSASNTPVKGEPSKNAAAKNTDLRKRISFTVPGLVVFVSVITLSTFLITIAISEHRQDVVKSIILKLTPPDPSKNSMASEHALVSNMKQDADQVHNAFSKSTKLEDAFKPGTEIKSKIEDTDSSQKRRFEFNTNKSIGWITNHYAKFLNGGNLPLFKQEMKGVVLAPAGEPLTFHLDGSICPEIYSYPDLIDRVNSSEFEELAITGNPEVPEESLQKGVNKFLATASGWKHLKSLELYSVPLDDESLELIDKMSLDNLLLSQCNVDAKLIAKHSTFSSLKSATLMHMNADELLPLLGKAPNLTRLDLVVTSFQPNSFEKLKAAPQLSSLIIEGGCAVGTISKLKEFTHLTFLYLKHVDIEPSDVPEFAKCKNVKDIVLSEQYVEAVKRSKHRDPRIEFRDDSTAIEKTKQDKQD